jgi:hypothetical protein
MYLSVQFTNRLTDVRPTQYTYYANSLFLLCFKHTNFILLLIKDKNTT